MKWKSGWEFCFTTIKVATRVSTVVRFTPLVLASEIAGGSRLHFFTVNKLYWIIVTFSRAVTYSQSEMSIQPLHVRRLLYFLQHGLHGCTPP
jgi:hypothetical protein